MVSEQVRRTSADARTRPDRAPGGKNLGTRFFDFKRSARGVCKKFRLEKPSRSKWFRTHRVSNIVALSTWRRAEQVPCAPPRPRGRGCRHGWPICRSASGGQWLEKAAFVAEVCPDEGGYSQCQRDQPSSPARLIAALALASYAAATP